MLSGNGLHPTVPKIFHDCYEWYNSAVNVGALNVDVTSLLGEMESQGEGEKDILKGGMTGSGVQFFRSIPCCYIFSH